MDLQELRNNYNTLHKELMELEIIYLNGKYDENSGYFRMHDNVITNKILHKSYLLEFAESKLLKELEHHKGLIELEIKDIQTKVKIKH